MYNTDNIARVRRDEAAAKAAEEAEDQRMQEVDAQRRLAILRGEAPLPLEDTADPIPTEDVEAKAWRADPSLRGHNRRKRKRFGEDDTDFELRIAKERHHEPLQGLEPRRKTISSAPITDRNGHIDLFGDEKARAHAEKNEEAEKESRKKKREYEDQYTMRFSNAAGRDGHQNPWYSKPEDPLVELPMKNAWGKDDPRRRERDAQRIMSNDPLAMMKSGASKVRALKQERKKLQEEREAEIGQMIKEERRRERHGRRYKDGPQTRSRSRSPGRRRHHSRSASPATRHGSSRLRNDAHKRNDNFSSEPKGQRSH